MANSWGNNANEIKRRLLLRRKVMTNLDSMLKSRNIILQTKVCLVKAMAFPVWMWESHYKEAERWRVGDFELWFWRRLLRVPWTAKRSNQPIQKEINLEYSLKGLMPKLKLQYFGHLTRKADSLEKPLILGKLKVGGEGDAKGRDGWIASLIQWTWVWASSRRWWRPVEPGMLQS